ncbi:hypothetical protein [uncultured Psychroserpens sp.]|uniref:hypothetical protein n=1 Tax=uncultured Psychroserpens sp. TaxID=255436 RepID=UPI00260E8CF7|nr:hypothetical protein [uncultured Psychroserpens sp.]
MKNSALFITTLLVVFIFGCSSDETQTPNDPPETNVLISEFTYSEVSPLTQETSVSKNYLLENNKIMSSTHFAQSFNPGVDDVMTNDVYSYANDQISEITTFDNGSVIRNIKYIYDSNGDLTEYINRFNNLNTQQSFYDKHTLTHTADTVFVERRRSTDGINYNTLVSDLKMVLDLNDNRTYFQTFNYININDQIEIKSNSYDANNNMVSQETSTIYPDGSTFFSNLQTYTYNLNHKNTLHYINENTFGRKNIMLLYHLELDVLNNFNPKMLSPNTMIDFSLTSPGSITFPIDINSTTNDEGYATFDEYTAYLEDGTSIASKFTIEYVFE